MIAIAPIDTHVKFEQRRRVVQAGGAVHAAVGRRGAEQPRGQARRRAQPARQQRRAARRAQHRARPARYVWHLCKQNHATDN